MFWSSIILIGGCWANFDPTECNKTKGCFMPSSDISMSYRVIDKIHVEFEISFKAVQEKGVYGALGFSKTGAMSPAPVLECSAIGSEPLSLKFSYNEGRSNIRIKNKIEKVVLSNTIATVENGEAYCKGVMEKVDEAKIYKWNPEEEIYLLLATGGTTDAGLKRHSVKFVSSKMKLQQSSAAISESSNGAPKNTAKNLDCGVTKGCFSPTDDITVFYRVFDDRSVEFEITFKAPSNTDFYGAVGFSKDGKMMPAPVLECSSIGAQPWSMKFSYNEGRSNIRIEDEVNIRKRILGNNSIVKTENGRVYCRGTVLWESGVGEKFYQYDADQKVHLLLAMGPTTLSGLSYHTSKFVSSKRRLADYTTDNSVGRSWKIECHAVLMTISWMILVPTAVIAARMLRSSWPETKPCNLLIWFHIHRNFNQAGICFTIIAFIVIMSHKGWRLSVGEHFANHEICGLATITLALMQPIGAIFRCGPKAPNRPIFNVIHRTVGFLGICMATAAITIAINKFTKSILNVLLATLPYVLIFLISIVYYFKDKVTKSAEKEHSGEGEAEEEEQLLGIIKKFDVRPVPPDPENVNVLDEYREIITFSAIAIFFINGIYLVITLGRTL